MRIPLFVDTIRLPYIGTLALADTGNWYHWPMSSPLNDFKSKPLLQRAIDSVGRLQAGDAVIVEKEPDKLLDEIRLLLDAVTARCRLEPVSAGDFYQVFALQDCGAPPS